MKIEIITTKEFNNARPYQRIYSFWIDGIKYRRCSTKKSGKIYVKGDKEGWDLLNERMKNSKGLIYNIKFIHRELVLAEL
jgi:hypothetical protein